MGLGRKLGNSRGEKDTRPGRKLENSYQARQAGMGQCDASPVGNEDKSLASGEKQWRGGLKRLAGPW